MTLAPPDTEAFLRREYPFTDTDFTAIAAYAQTHFGINLPASKRQLVYSRLAKRLRALQLPDFATYIARLGSPVGQAEHTELLAALATNTTHFFRERHHFDLLEKEVLPPAIARLKAGQGRLRIWSAGCSTGQEPYSLAMTVLTAMPDAARHDVRILATDIVPAIADRARAARYSEEEMQSLPDPYRKRFVETLPDGGLTFTAEVRGLVRFGILNLIEPLPFRGPFDAIFCRNVAIYFDKDVQAQVWQTLASVLAPEGYLFIGHSERLGGPVEAAFKSCGITTYRHIAGARSDRAESARRSA